jgi:hypothetical protein
VVILSTIQFRLDYARYTKQGVMGYTALSIIIYIIATIYLCSKKKKASGTDPESIELPSQSEKSKREDRPLNNKSETVILNLVYL